jgi:L-lysine exporter family protein LysE/ArgO
MLQSPAAEGFLLSLSLIIAIGAQNAFVIRQGLKREHLILVPLICFICDAILIGFGALGFGSIVAKFPQIAHLAAWAGAIFLFGYGAKSFYSAVRPGKLDVAGRGATLSWKQAAMQTLAFSLLNPHVYLDTVFLLGSVAGQYARTGRVQFVLGGVTASFVWFFSLSWGASLLAPVLNRPAAWRVLDLGIGAMMWLIAYSLIRGHL